MNVSQSAGTSVVRLFALPQIGAGIEGAGGEETPVTVIVTVWPGATVMLTGVWARTAAAKARTAAVNRNRLTPSPPALRLRGAPCATLGAVAASCDPHSLLS